MIKSVYIHNFKVFADVEQLVAPLTILTGLNGRGKSSFIQAILLAWSTLKNSNPLLHLNNEYVGIGTVRDAFSWYSEDRRFCLGLTYGEKDYRFESVPVEFYMASQVAFDLDTSLNRYFPYNDPGADLRYFSTWRMGNLRGFPIATKSQMETGSLSVHHGDGKLTPRFLWLNPNRMLPITSLVCEEGDEPMLSLAVDKWLNFISPDLKIRIEQGDGEMRLGYYAADVKGSSTLVADAVNVGYGISYALPVVTSVLASKPGDIVVVETPEAHIHPAGQAKLMDLFAKATAAGVQVILETHSDHIIHGLLRNLKKGVLDENDAKVLYFDRHNDMHQCQDGIVINTLQCTNNGRIKGAPKGFFDQYMIDMDELL